MLFNLFKEKEYKISVIPQLTFRMDKNDLDVYFKYYFDTRTSNFIIYSDLLEKIKSYYKNQYKYDELLKMHNILVSEKQIPYFNSHLIKMIDKEFLFKIIIERLSALTVDLFISKYNQEIEKKYKESFENCDYTELTNHYFSKKNYLDECIEVCKKIDKLFDNNHLNTRIKFKNNLNKNQYIFNSHIFNSMDYGLKINLNKNMISNLKNIIENYEEVLNCFDNSLLLHVKEGKFNLKSQTLNHFQIDYSKIDIAFIPLIPFENFENYQFAISSQYYNDDYGLTVLEHDKKLNSKNTTKVIKKINTEIVNY